MLICFFVFLTEVEIVDVLILLYTMHELYSPLYIRLNLKASLNSNKNDLFRASPFDSDL